MSSKNSPFNISGKDSFNKEIVIPASKSHSNRALILGAIRGKNFKVYNVSTSSDVTNLISALKKIGLRLKIDGSSVVFENSFPECEKESEDDIIRLDTGDGGTTNRFLIAMLSRGKKEYHLYPTEKMKDRPIVDLLLPLRQLDVKITQNVENITGEPWIKIKGPASLYNSTKLRVDCRKSTQFASALMLAFSNLPLQFEFVNLHSSETYLKMTAYVMKKSIENNSYTVPVDFSSLGYPAALAGLMGRVLVTNCFQTDEYQADSILLNILEESGVSLSYTEKGLEIKRNDVLKTIKFDVSLAPDLFMTLVFLAAHVDGESVFSNLEILKFKESDRIEETLKILSSFGVKYVYDSTRSILRIDGSSQANYLSAEVHPPRDHRIVMMAALFMLKNRGGTLFEINCVEKSFPDFAKLME